MPASKQPVSLNLQERVFVYIFMDLYYIYRVRFRIIVRSRTIQNADKDHTKASLADPGIYWYYPYIYGIIISLDKKRTFCLQSRLTLVDRTGFHSNSYRLTRAIRLRYNIRAYKTSRFVHYVLYIVNRFYYYYFFFAVLFIIRPFCCYSARTTLHRNSRSLWKRFRKMFKWKNLSA